MDGAGGFAVAIPSEEDTGEGGATLENEEETSINLASTTILLLLLSSTKRKATLLGLLKHERV